MIVTMIDQTTDRYIIDAPITFQSDMKDVEINKIRLFYLRNPRAG